MINMQNVYEVRAQTHTEFPYRSVEVKSQSHSLITFINLQKYVCKMQGGKNKVKPFFFLD